MFAAFVKLGFGIERKGRSGVPETVVKDERVELVENGSLADPDLFFAQGDDRVVRRREQQLFIVRSRLGCSKFTLDHECVLNVRTGPVSTVFRALS